MLETFPVHLCAEASKGTFIVLNVRKCWFLWNVPHYILLDGIGYVIIPYNITTFSQTQLVATSSYVAEKHNAEFSTDSTVWVGKVSTTLAFGEKMNSALADM